MGEFYRNVWAPWRMQYIESLSEHEQRGCFLCRLQQTPHEGEQDYVLRHSAQLLMVLNRFPYTTGHLLVAPTAHVAQLDELPEEVLYEMTSWLCDAKRVLQSCFSASGIQHRHERGPLCGGWITGPRALAHCAALGRRYEFYASAGGRACDSGGTRQDL